MNKQKELENVIAADQAVIERAKKFFQEGTWDEELTAVVITDSAQMIERNTERLNDLKAHKAKLAK